MAIRSSSFMAGSSSRFLALGLAWGLKRGRSFFNEIAQALRRFWRPPKNFRMSRMPWRIAISRWPVLGPIGVRGLNLFAKSALTMAVCKHERMTVPVRAGFLAPYGNWHDRVAILHFVQDIPLTPAHPSYGTLVLIEESLALFRKSPMLFVWGMRDWCFTPVFLDEFVTRFPQAEVLRLADAGHYVFEDAHEEIIPRLRAFLDAHPLGRSPTPLIA
jgi:haloalkane dehalogenase